MNKKQKTEARVLTILQNPRTIRSRAHQILNLAQQNKLKHFSLHPEKMIDTASFVTEIIQQQYPDLNIPYHSRWRHFEAGGIDRIHTLRQQTDNLSDEEWGKKLYELVIISVLFDAGAGSLWQFHDSASHTIYTRSEGLALASLHLYTKGVFSNDPKDPLRVDAPRLLEFTEQDLHEAFQVSSTNPLEGIAGRTALMNQLGKVIQAQPSCFNHSNRLGEFYTYISTMANPHQQLQAAQIFKAILTTFHEIWPVRLCFHGRPLGDVGQHQALKTSSPGSEYIPFHKLSQWLTYSLIEPLEHHGIQVTHLETLTGLPEYRNGGLLIDTGLLRVIHEDDLQHPHDPCSEIIVEWRALTVALLDELADLIRIQMRKNADELPLAKILQGGTWEAGRRIARQKRQTGTPPLHIISDGTVF